MSKTVPVTIRCAIYTRKSASDGLDQEFNSLDAQRQAGEAYITSQAGAGWVCLPHRYDDGGFTGANVERPAFKRLMADVASGGIDCIVLYKVDRLSRSLMDFARIMETLEHHGVSFVSVTQHFNTSQSMGRLTLNILLSFAQFEREIISERTRDKIAAARRSGYWSGGIPPLGYDIDRSNGSIRLVVIPLEADRVRRIFELYLDQRSLLKVTRILDQRGWRTKRWVTRKGQQRGGRRFEKSTLLYLLRNITGCGKLRHRGEVHEGRHEAVIPEELYNHVQARLDHNGPRPRNGPRNLSRSGSGAMLNGLLFCAHCDRAMTHSSSSNGSRRYRYYVCTQASRRGWDTCPSKSLPAGVIEQFVIDQLLAPGIPPGIGPGIEDIDECPRQDLKELALRWDTLSSSQRHDAIHRLVKRVEYEGATGTVRMTLALNGGDEILSKDASPATREFMIERHVNFERGTRGRKQLTQKPDRNHPQPSPRVPRVSRLMALAIHFDKQLRRGELRDYAQIARLGQVSRARITQIMSLLNLAPDIQEAILYIPPVERGRDPIRELILRPIAAEPDWARQGRMWSRLKRDVPLIDG